MKTTVIGSGFGGIAAALRLRAMGHDVTLLEKLNEIGGRAQQFQRAKYLHDAGPTVITAPNLSQLFLAIFLLLSSFNNVLISLITSWAKILQSVMRID